MSPMKTTCDDCWDGDVPFYRGQIVTKGPMPCEYCKECGTIVRGSPGLIAHLYRWYTGTWPWQ